MEEKVKQKRGFASMTPEKVRAIARFGGQSVPAHRRGYALDKELAIAAGKKGGAASAAARKRRKEQWESNRE